MLVVLGTWAAQGRCGVPMEGTKNTLDNYTRIPHSNAQVTRMSAWYGIAHRLGT